MDESTERVLITICRFSKYFGVPYPDTTNIGRWWDRALVEMKEENIYFLHNIGLFSGIKNTTIQRLRKKLEMRVLELKSSHKEGHIN